MQTPGIPGTSGPRTVLSVWPMARSLELRHEGLKTYTIAAAPRGSFSTLTVPDTYAWCRNFHAEGFALFQNPIPASVVADNLVQAWSTGMVGTKDGLGPGVMVCAGPEPTEDEIAAVTAVQEAYFRYLINEADALFAKEGMKDITDVHRLAAYWMGTNDRQWAKPITKTDMRPCPGCGEEIRAIARICRWCHSDVSALDQKIAKERMAAQAPQKG